MFVRRRGDVEQPEAGVLERRIAVAGVVAAGEERVAAGLGVEGAAIGDAALECERGGGSAEFAGEDRVGGGPVVGIAGRLDRQECAAGAGRCIEAERDTAAVVRRWGADAGDTAGGGLDPERVATLPGGVEWTQPVHLERQALALARSCGYIAAAGERDEERDEDWRGSLH